MKFKAHITEDTFSQYLNTLQTKIDKTQKPLLKELGEIFVKFVHPRVDTGYLEASGEDKDNWFFDIKAERSILEIMYTGKDNPSRWWEFLDVNNPSDKSKWRDYAYFQETGIDSVAESKYARGKHYLYNATIESKTDIYNQWEQYVKELLEG